MMLLDRHKEHLTDANGVRASAEQAIDVLSAPGTPDRGRVMELLNQVAVGVGRVAALATAISAIQTAVTHLLS